MSEIQGRISSDANEVMVASKAEKELITTDHHNNQLHISASAIESMTITPTEDKDHAMQNNTLTSEETRDVSNNGESLNIIINETKNQTVSGKQNQAIEKSVSVIMKPMSPFAKFHELDRQNSLPLPTSTTRKTSKKELTNKFTKDSVVENNAVQIKERLLAWCRSKTQEYENVQIDNFSTSWNNGMAFCALLHHFKPEAFDYGSLKRENRRYNFQLAFEKAEEIAEIAPLLDVEDMVAMRRPDWKCVFTYVQSIYRRFKNED